MNPTHCPQMLQCPDFHKHVLFLFLIKRCDHSRSSVYLALNAILDYKNFKDPPKIILKICVTLFCPLAPTPRARIKIILNHFFFEHLKS